MHGKCMEMSFKIEFNQKIRKSFSNFSLKAKSRECFGIDFFTLCTDFK